VPGFRCSRPNPGRPRRTSPELSDRETVCRPVETSPPLALHIGPYRRPARPTAPAFVPSRSHPAGTFGCSFLALFRSVPAALVCSRAPRACARCQSEVRGRQVRRDTGPSPSNRAALSAVEEPWVSPARPCERLPLTYEPLSHETACRSRPASTAFYVYPASNEMRRTHPEAPGCVPPSTPALTRSGPSRFDGLKCPSAFRWNANAKTQTPRLRAVQPGPRSHSRSDRPRRFDGFIPVRLLASGPKNP